MIAGAGSNVNLLAALSVAGASLLGVTIMRTHLVLYVTSAVTLADELRVGLVVARLADVGAGPPAGAVSAADPELDWMLLRDEFATPTFGPLNNTLTYDLKAKRRMQELNQAYVLALSNSAGGSKTVKIFARTLLALP
jgi:hypothetical protein